LAHKQEQVVFSQGRYLDAASVAKTFSAAHPVSWRQHVCGEHSRSAGEINPWRHIYRAWATI